VDLGRRQATIEDSGTKNGQPLGVPLNDLAMAVLERQRGRHAVRVFTYRRKPVESVNTKAWKEAPKRCGIRDFRWHDLRHTWASWLRQQDVPTWVLQQLGGWKSESMVRRNAHLSVKQLQPYADQLTFPVTVPAEEEVAQNRDSAVGAPGHKNGPSGGRPALRLVVSNS
jgi:integrase